jgi:hypothetical protein|tara:strand:- start:21 stop:515 length:495 start_codon:yes stop_codon:yes gene_type:complete
MKKYNDFFYKSNLNILFKFISTFAVPIGVILYLQFKSIAPTIMLHNIIIAGIGAIDIYVRQLKNRQPVEQLKLLGMPSDITNVVCFLLHVLLVAVIIYRPVDPLRIPLESHLLLILVAIIIFGIPWWPYVISRAEMFLAYVTMYFGLYIGSIILDKKLLNLITF